MGMNSLAQMKAITAANIRTLKERKASSAVTVVGIAGLVAILVGVLSMREGFRVALDLAGAEDIAVVLSAGSDTESSSSLTLEQADIVAAAQATARENDAPLVSPESYLVVKVPLRRTHTDANASLRGVGPEAAKLRAHFKLIKGRMFESGRFELLIGRGAAAHFAGLDVDSRVRMGNVEWRVVGLFEDGGSVSESELWTDSGALQSAYRRGNTFQSVRVKLKSPGSLANLKDELSRDPRLSVSVLSERAYYSQQSRALSNLVTRFGYMIAILMGIGAIFGALSTMYAAVNARTREIATLRALGFGAGPVVASVLGESLLLGLLGGLVGCIVAYVGFNGIQASTLNFRSFSQLSFAFTVTPRLLLQGLIIALLLSLFGGVLPGLRSAKLSIVQGLREL